jgi:hypothetical protein
MLSFSIPFSVVFLKFCRVCRPSNVLCFNLFAVSPHFLFILWSHGLWGLTKFFVSLIISCQWQHSYARTTTNRMGLGALVKISLCGAYLRSMKMVECDGRHLEESIWVSNLNWVGIVTSQVLEIMQGTTRVHWWRGSKQVLSALCGLCIWWLWTASWSCVPRPLQCLAQPRP